MKKILLLSLILFSFCVPRQIHKIESPFLKYEKEIKEADAYIDKGCYFSLQKAHQIYNTLYSIPSLRKIIAEKLIKTSLLLNLREKELGIINGNYITEASQLIEKNSSLGNFLSYMEIIDFLSIKIEGVIEDIEKRKLSWKIFNEKLKEIQGELKEKAEEDVFFAYLYTHLYCSYFLIERKDTSIFLKYYPNSLLIKYKLATCREENLEILNEIIKVEPCFYEIYFHLGKVALKRKRLFEAEQYFLKALEKISNSISGNISLASIYFYFEEFEESLRFYNKTLSLAPYYRDALLGKAICLSYLEKYKEAISVLERLLFLGKWYLGETNYWLAWNKQKLGFLEEAWLNIEKAKKYLPTSSEVYTFSGILAFERNNLNQAEKDLKKALIFEPSNAEALFHLGSLYAEKEDWENSGVYFEKASHAYEALENFTEVKINKIKNSSISEKRKKRILIRLQKKLKKIFLLKATAFYNASASYYNANLKEKALIMAKKASTYPLFTKKAEEIISKIKKSKQ